jgi:hypothetical protein
MQSPIKSIADGHAGLLCTATVWAMCLTGCCGGILTSARYAAPSPQVATLPTASALGPTASSATHGETACVVAPAGYCGADECPPLVNWPRGLWARCLGPLFHGRGQAGMTEAELYPPHSRFHPVPTAPVFAPRDDYEPPERMMEPAPAHPRLAPQSLPRVPDVQLLPMRVAPRPETESAPANRSPGGVLPERILPEPLPDEKTSREPQSVLLLRR